MKRSPQTKKGLSSLLFDNQSIDRSATQLQYAFASHATGSFILNPSLSRTQPRLVSDFNQIKCVAAGYYIKKPVFIVLAAGRGYRRPDILCQCPCVKSSTWSNAEIYGPFHFGE